MFIHTIETLDDLELKINQFYMDVQLNPETYKEIREAIIKQRNNLNK